MRKFEAPLMNVVRLDPDGVISASSCFEAFACKECYCSVVQCGNDTYTCTGLVCDSLSDYD